jgi:RimJ/RimL family protein N-acetyltransferase
MIPTRVLDGHQVRLRPLDERDVELLARWFGDPEVRHWTHLSEDPPSAQTLESHRERYHRMRADPRQLRFCIETLDGHPIGDLGLVDIHPHGRAELGITIGDKAYWSRGYGVDAIRTALRYAFGQLGCRRVYLITDEDNRRAHRCFAKCGFVHEGLLRAHRLRHGLPLNMLMMGVLRSDFEAIRG